MLVAKTSIEICQCARQVWNHWTAAISYSQISFFPVCGSFHFQASFHLHIQYSLCTQTKTGTTFREDGNLWIWCSSVSEISCLMLPNPNASTFRQYGNFRTLMMPRLVESDLLMVKVLPQRPPRWSKFCHRDHHSTALLSTIGAHFSNTRKGPLILRRMRTWNCRRKERKAAKLMENKGGERDREGESAARAPQDLFLWEHR